MKQLVQLNEIMTSGKNSKILIFFLNNPAIELSQLEIIKKVSIAKATAVKWLEFLVQNNVLNCKKIGVTKLYKLNNENIIVKQLKILNILIQLEPLKKIKNKEIELYLYGSCARGEQTENSDIDLLVIGNIHRNEIINEIDNLSKKINKKINFKIFTNMHWSTIQKKDKAFYTRIEKDKLRII